MPSYTTADITPTGDAGYDLAFSPGGMTGIEHGGNHYLFVREGEEFGAGDQLLHVLKGTSGGGSWSDIASMAIGAASSVAMCQDGTTVHIVWSDTFGVTDTCTALKHATFNLSSDTLSGSSTVSGAPTIYKLYEGGFYNANKKVGLILVRRGTGDMFFLYSSAPFNAGGGLKYGRVGIAAFDGSSMSGAAEIPGQTGNGFYSAAGAVMDTSSNLHCLISGRPPALFLSAYCHVAMDSVGMWGAFQTVDSHVENPSSGPAEELSNFIDFDASGEKIAFLGVALGNVLTLYYASAGSLAPTWSTQAITTSQPPVVNSSIAWGHATTLLAVNGILTAYWASSGTLAGGWDITEDLGKILYSETTLPSLSGWTADAILIQNDAFSASTVIAYSGATEAGIFAGFNEPGDRTQSAWWAGFPLSGGGGAIGIDCNDPPDGEVGTPYSHTLTVTNAPTGSTFSIIGGALPDGLTLDSSTGAISGTPTLFGSFVFVVQIAAPAGGGTAFVSCTINILYGTLSTSCGTVPVATVGAVFEFRPIVMLGSIALPPVYDANGVLVWTFPSVAPPGFMWDDNPVSPTYGKLIGTGPGGTVPPGASGGGFTYTVTTPADSQSVTETCDIVVQPPVIDCAAPPDGTVGVPYSHQINLSQGSPPYTVTVSGGALPNGLSISNTGLITGTPTTAGPFYFTLSVTDSTAITGTGSCSIDVNPGGGGGGTFPGGGLGCPSGTGPQIGPG